MFAIQAADLRFGEKDGCGTDRYCAAVDLGLPPYFHTDMYCLVYAMFKQGAGTLFFLCADYRFFELPDDLVLTDNHGIDAGRKFEQVMQRLDSGMQEKTFSTGFFEKIPEAFGIPFDHYFDPVTGLEKESSPETRCCIPEECVLIFEPESL